MTTTTVGMQVRAIDPHEERALNTDLAVRSQLASPFATIAWREAWWSTLGRGRRLSLLAEADGAPSVLAPWYVDGGVAYPAGVDGADRLDLIGAPTAASVTALVDAARRLSSGLLGVLLYHVPVQSPTLAALRAAGDELGLTAAVHDAHVLPAIDLTDRAWVERILERTSLRRHHRRLARLGELTIERHRTAEGIGRWLETLFDMHVARWQSRGAASLFEDTRQRAFYRALAAGADEAGWLRMTVVLLDRVPVACHLGMSIDGVFVWYKPTFDPRYARHSPGEVLLRALLLEAIDEGAHTFDFGLGDEAFKRRFATRFDEVVSVALWEPEGRRS